MNKHRNKNKQAKTIDLDIVLTIKLKPEFAKQIEENGKSDLVEYERAAEKNIEAMLKQALSDENAKVIMVDVEAKYNNFNMKPVVKEVAETDGNTENKSTPKESK